MGLAYTVFVAEGSSHQKRHQGSATLKLLQAHGITMLPADETTLVASAMESGQTVVLTGKFCDVYMTNCYEGSPNITNIMLGFPHMDFSV
jgi:hypothetical protein